MLGYTGWGAAAVYAVRIGKLWGAVGFA